MSSARKGSISRNSCNFPSEASGIQYNTYFAQSDRVCAGLYIKDNKEVFDALLAQREAIERELGESLEWHAPDDVTSHITLHYEGSIENSEERLAEIRTWAIDRLLRLKRVFGPRLAEPSRRRVS